MSNHNPTSRASRELIVRLGQTLQGNTALFDDVFVDPLHPQLLNRKAFDRILADDDLRGLVWSVTYADADGLKRLNDSAGHEAGDDFLRAIVDTWSLATRAWDRADSLIFRLGGDEFAVLWFEDGGEGQTRLGDAWDVRFALYDNQGVTYSSRWVWGGADAAESLRLAEADVTEAKADRARTEVEALRHRVAELEAQQEENARQIASLRVQVECEQREQDRLRLELRTARHDLKVERLGSK